EFKHDETNGAWWTRRCYGRGFGAQASSQAVWEYVVKIIELSLWSLDLLLGHLLLFILSLPLLIPGFDRLHAVMLFWLRHSKHIRASSYSMKQSSQRRAIVSHPSFCELHGPKDSAHQIRNRITRADVFHLDDCAT
ncbi:hypothetical protein C8J56DRAFT_770800, partial [Mycena floridula]